MTNYDRDFYAWTQEQAKLLRDHRTDLLDWENLSEEIESLGKRERQELRNRLAILIGHLLKWQHQPGNQSTSWKATIREQRLQLTQHLQDNPSLKPYIPEALELAYPRAMNLAIRETGLEVFPETCPYRLEQVLNEAFFPASSVIG
ncbi:MAG: DUF29 domain-containing protein [Cyanobacteria bacterium CRU_2_1]|nr:DUF29 domain-containing protein [Cyanobacteria bacterium RU_5_0]NJR60221.1 DUF29 domain-containing protein [Cyanobacteria bacterium CRU_2_1]